MNKLPLLALFIVMLAVPLSFAGSVSYDSTYNYYSVSMDGWGAFSAGTCLDLDVVRNITLTSLSNLSVSCSSPVADIKCASSRTLQTLNDLKRTATTHTIISGSGTGHAYGMQWVGDESGIETVYGGIWGVTSEGYYYTIRSSGMYGENWCYMTVWNYKNVTGLPYLAYTNSKQIFLGNLSGNVTGGDLYSNTVCFDMTDMGFSVQSINNPCPSWADWYYANTISGSPNKWCSGYLSNCVSTGTAERCVPTPNNDNLPVNNLLYTDFWSCDLYHNGEYGLFNVPPANYSFLAIKAVNNTNKNYDNYSYMTMKMIDNRVWDLNPYTFFWMLYQDDYSGIGGVYITPSQPLPDVPVVSHWTTSQSADSRFWWRSAPLSNTSSWSAWGSIYNLTYDTVHELTLPAIYVVNQSFYQWYVESIRYGASSVSLVANFTVGGTTPTPTTTTTTTTTLPYGSDTANGGKIQSVSYDDRYPSLDQTVRFDIYITNNGTRAGNYSVGLSIGNVTSGVWCNRDCYNDGLGDYAHTGKVEVGSTVMVSRWFKFRHEFFEPSRNYSMAIGLYPYDYSETNFDYDIFSNAITTQSIAEKVGGGMLAYPLSVVVTPDETRRGGEVKVTSYVLNNGSVTYNFKLGMSLGVWDKNESIIYNSTQPALVHPCNLECYTDDLGDWVYLEIPANYTAPFTRRFKIPDYFLENTYADVAVCMYVGDTLISCRYFDNRIMVQEGGVSGQPTEILEPTGAILGSLLGIDTTSAVLLVILCIVMGVGIYAAYKTKHAEIGVLVMVLMIIAFFIAGKIPLWVMILIVIVASAIAAKMFGGLFGGGGG